MIKQLFIVIVFMISGQLKSQDWDKARMERDLEVTEEVIVSLLQSQVENGEFRAAQVSAEYVPGFGVMINMDMGKSFYPPSLSSEFNFHWSYDDSDWEVDIERVEAEAAAITEQVREILRENGLKNDMSEEEYKSTLKEIEKELEMHHKKKGDCDGEDCELCSQKSQVILHLHQPPTPEEIESVKNEGSGEDFFYNISESYFLDYARLIGQLSEEDKVMLTCEIDYKGKEDGQKFIASLNNQYLMDKSRGKLSDDELIDGIEYTTTSLSPKKTADLELISSIFQRLYKSDLATTYYSESKISYELLENFGVVFKMKVYSSYQKGKNSYRVVALNRSNLTKKERDELVNSMYDQFETELKEHMLDYGRTITSLKEEEKLVFQVALTQCDDCAMPKNIKVLVEKSVLSQYDQGKLEKEEAMREIQVLREEN